MRKQISIPVELIDYANTKDIDEMLRILGDAVRYRLTGEIVNEELLELLDANLKRSKKMIGNKNSVTHTVKQCDTDCKQTATHCQNSLPQTVKQCDTHLFITDENWLNQKHEESGGFIYNNILLLNIIIGYIDNNITYPSINYQIKKHGKEKFIQTQIIEAEKLIKKIGFQTLQVILQYLPHDDFWSKNILSIAKLNKKNKDGVPYYAVIMDRIKQYRPTVVSIPTV